MFIRSTRSICIKPERLANKSRVVHASPENTNATAAGISEDVLARLRAAEDEASRLRKELAQAKGVDPLAPKPKRVDSVTERESGPLFGNESKKKQSSWLSEADVDFFTGGAPVGEKGSEPVDKEMEATVSKRLIIGLLGAAGVGALSFIPTEALRIKPDKPLYFYVVPLLRCKELLQSLQATVADADWETLRLILPRINGPPNNANENMGAIVALLEDSRDAKRAAELAGEFVEYLLAIDYQKYFETIPNQAPTGAQNIEFSKFSTKSLKAAIFKLDDFLSLIPPQDLQDATAQMENGNIGL